MRVGRTQETPTRASQVPKVGRDRLHACRALALWQSLLHAAVPASKAATTVALKSVAGRRLGVDRRYRLWRSVWVVGLRSKLEACTLHEPAAHESRLGMQVLADLDASHSSSSTGA